MRQLITVVLLALWLLAAGSLAQESATPTDDATWLGKVPYLPYPNAPAKGKIDGKPLVVFGGELRTRSHENSLVLYDEKDRRPICAIEFQREAPILDPKGKSFTQIRIPNPDFKKTGYVYDPKNIKDVSLYPKPGYTVCATGFAIRMSIMPKARENAMRQLPVYLVLRWERKYDSYIEGLCWVDVK